MNFYLWETNRMQEQKAAFSLRTFSYGLLRTPDHVLGTFLESKYLLIGMVGLQLSWLAAIVWTGASSQVDLILWLAAYSICSGIVVFLLPASLFTKLTAWKTWLLERPTRFLLLLSLVVILGGVFYAANQRIWGDEERSFRVAKLISAKGVEGAYQESGWLSKKHPPLVPTLYSLTLDAAGTHFFYLRLVSVLFLTGSVLVTYGLGRVLYGQHAGYRSAVLFLFFPLVIRMGTSAMMDIQLTFFFSLALLASLYLVRRPSVGRAILTGFLLGLGLLTKYTMVLSFGVLVLSIFFLPQFRSQKLYFLLASAVALLAFSGWLMYANQIGILSGQIEKIKQFSGIYYLLNSPQEEQQPAESALAAAEPEAEAANSARAIQNGILKLGLETLFTRLPSSLGVHLLPLILAGVIFLLKAREPSDLFLLFWIGVIFTVLFLTLPDHRYFLPAFPAIAILISRLLARFPENAQRAILLSFLFLGANLYLFVDWVRESHLFLSIQ